MGINRLIGRKIADSVDLREPKEIIMRASENDDIELYEAPHTLRGLDEAERDAANYRINGKTAAQRRAPAASSPELAAAS